MSILLIPPEYESLCVFKQTFFGLLRMFPIFKEICLFVISCRCRQLAILWWLTIKGELLSELCHQDKTFTIWFSEFLFVFICHCFLYWEKSKLFTQGLALKSQTYRVTEISQSVNNGFVASILCQSHKQRLILWKRCYTLFIMWHHSFPCQTNG